jgi:hypothetical protein
LLNAERRSADQVLVGTVACAAAVRGRRTVPGNIVLATAPISAMAPEAAIAAVNPSLNATLPALVEWLIVASRYVATDPLSFSAGRCERHVQLDRRRVKIS